jgi:hypothetical protein
MTWTPSLMAAIALVASSAHQGEHRPAKAHTARLAAAGLHLMHPSPTPAAGVATIAPAAAAGCLALDAGGRAPPGVWLAPDDGPPPFRC